MCGVSVSQCVCVSVGLSVCLSLSVFWSVLCIWLPLCVFVCLFVCVCSFVSVCLYVYLFFCPSVCLSISLFAYYRPDARSSLACYWSWDQCIDQPSGRMADWPWPAVVHGQCNCLSVTHTEQTLTIGLMVRLHWQIFIAHFLLRRKFANVQLRTRSGHDKMDSSDKPYLKRLRRPNALMLRLHWQIFIAHFLLRRKLASVNGHFLTLFPRRDVCAEKLWHASFSTRKKCVSLNARRKKCAVHLHTW